MATVNPATTPTTSATGTTGTTGTTGSTSKTSLPGATTLGKDDFLKLLVAQLQHQDPMAPTSDNEWIGQMAQFSALEQQTNTAQSTGEMASQLTRAGALGLIGKTVTYGDTDGNSQTGTVTQVDIGADGKATLTVGATGGIDAGSVTQVK